MAISVAHTRKGVTDVASFLVSLGYERIASGRFSSVYAHPQREGVVKVWDSYDRGYLDFLNFIVVNQHLSGVPKLLGGLVSYPDARKLSIRLERLDPGDGERNGVIRALYCLGPHAIKTIPTKLRPELWRLYKAGMKWAAEHYPDGWKYPRNSDLLDSQNILRRGDQPVIVDAW